MADLEDMLLEAAGRSGTSGRKTQSDGSDSNYNDSKFSTGKHSGSNVPLKKRFEHSKNNDQTSWVNENIDYDNYDKSSGDDSDSAPSIGSDLYKDDKDKEELGKMTELDREMILAERSTRIDDYWLTKKARESSSKAEYSTKESPLPLSSRSRLSVRSEKVSGKIDALKELRSRRMKQQDPEGYRKFRDLAAAGTGFVADAEGSSDSDAGTSTDDKEDKSQVHNYVVDNLDDLLTSDSKPLGFEDVKEITIRRSKLVKWFMEPFFEDIIVGCFVRVGVARTRTGPKYRLCLVKSVDASDPDQQYKLEGRTTHKWLNCTWGFENLAERWQMAVISDSQPLEEEFMELVEEVERSGGKMPNRYDVNNKKGKIQEISNFIYSAETVKLMLEQKKSTSTRPLNIAAEKTRLRKEIEAAESRGEDSETKRLQTKLKELAEVSWQSKQFDAKAVKLAEINRKNKLANFRNASERRPINTSLKAGEEGYDPFSRRWTRSRNYYPSKPGGVPDEATVNEANESAIKSSVDANGMGANKGAEVGMEATAAALDAAACAGKLVDTNAPVDQETELNLLHIFELPISLAGLQSFGGPRGARLAFMSRKQKIEATIGCKAPENDGKRHSLTLTVSDYKRRRGLL
ncbi:hypothetical protein IEQ34_001819 [Dendrobium chrysotoxum]|uniref:Plus3 domain-containing protein n=1 Tax=Dendrobium chrysotoxum TaxID=161865 RepID=A0AAV7HMQ3_DENCH|nr:hypothetical protein IEQ34_001819 [Dendrobium chrysotoxum]